MAVKEVKPKVGKFDLEAYKKSLINGNSLQTDIEEAIVYKIEHKVNGKIYIGRTIRNPEKRWREHGWHNPKPKSRSLINEAIQRDGEAAFTYEVIAIVARKAIDMVEANYIEYYQSLAPRGYNCVKLYNGPEMSDETRTRMSNSRLGKSPWNKGRRGVQEAWNKGIPNYSHMIPIVAINNTTGEIKHYSSSMEAVRDLNLNSGHVTQCCKGKLTQHKGYSFKYLKDYIDDQGGLNVQEN